MAKLAQCDAAARARYAATLADGPSLVQEPKTLGDTFAALQMPSSDSLVQKEEMVEAGSAATGGDDRGLRAPQARRGPRRALRAIPAAFAGLTAETVGSRVSDPATVGASLAAVNAHGIVWMGIAGSGKTSLACAMVAEWLGRHEGLVFVVSARKLATARSRHPLGEGEPEPIARAMAADLLVLDDLGAETETPTSGDAIGDVIHERYDAARLTWVTTGISGDQILTRYGAGVHRRIFERAAVVMCKKAKVGTR